MAGLSQGLVIEASSVDRPLQRQGRLRPRSAHMRRIVRRTSRAVSLIAVCLINACGSSSVGVTPSTSASATPAAPVARGYSWLVDASGDGGVYLFGGFTGPPRKNGKWVPDLWSFRYRQGWKSGYST